MSETFYLTPEVFGDKQKKSQAERPTIKYNTPDGETRDGEVKDSNNEKLAILTPQQASAMRSEAHAVRAARHETDNDSNYQHELADLLNPNNNEARVVKFRKSIGL